MFHCHVTVGGDYTRWTSRTELGHGQVRLAEGPVGTVGFGKADEKLCSA